MIKMIYLIDPKDKATEQEWLRSQMIFPSCEDIFDWSAGKIMSHFGVIVTADVATAIKLRHKLSAQDNYRRTGR